MLAIVCPGQGSQTPGFLSTWLEIDSFRDTLSAWSKATGVDLVAHGTESDAETIKDTAIAQPLIVAAGLLSARAAGIADLDASTWVTSGHSVGEITATALAGVLTETDALNFVRVRAEGMAQASHAKPTGMAAVIGGRDPEAVAAAITEAGLTPANMNGGGQIVAAGDQDALAGLAENPPEKTRVIPLKVAGAFHTEAMASAVEPLRRFAETLNPADPQVTIYSNRDGQSMSSGQDVLERLVAQVTHPVRWDLCQESLRDDAGVTGIIELLPGGTLAGLAKRGLKGIPTLAITSPEDLDQAREFIAEHATAGQ